MGLLSDGRPLSWLDAKEVADYVRTNGIEQFLSIYSKVKDRHNDCLKWGDEIEYVIVKMNDENQTAKLSLNTKEYLDILMEEENNHKPGDPPLDSLWRPEYGRFMIEGTPGGPYGHDIKDFLEVQDNMEVRRKKVKKLLKPGEFPVSVTNFPRLGCKHVSDPPHEPYGPIAKSLFIPDEFINEHPRFGTLTQCIRERRGSRVNISVPIFLDTNTPRPFYESFANDDGEAAKNAQPDSIYMDAMAFGMGCSCLQVTFQACSINEARYLYDQLAVVSPIMLALSAACPIFRGYLADVDCRWDVIAESVDDRTAEELGEVPLKNDKFRINKSRYDSIDSYLSSQPFFKKEYNDIDLVKDEGIYNTLIDNGIDELLAQHLAHLFIRDPLVVYKETLHQNNEKQSDHFENIQSTNWQTMRFKPPPPNSNIGWRVEFRTMEVQLSDFENAAYTVFIVLLTRVILSFNLNLYMPISKMDENVQNAQKRDAVNKQLFYFRKHLTGEAKFPDLQSPLDSNMRVDDDVDDEIELMDINTIVNGGGSDFPGLIPLIEAYLDSINVDVNTRCRISKYLSLISKRASGELKTAATYMRDFVAQHADYKHDSVISEKINYDLIQKIIRIGDGESVEELMGDLNKKGCCGD